MSDDELRKKRGTYRQRILFNMEHYAPYYGYGAAHTGQHKYSYAIDYAGKDSGKDPCYAPFDCNITYVFVKSGSSPEVWLQSDKPVLTRTGDIDYHTMTITHPSEIKKMKIGQKFKQGAQVCQEGREGGANGNHEHTEMSKGKSKYWSIEKHGGVTYYINQNKVKIDEVMFLPETSVIDYTIDIVGGKYPIKKESEMTRYVNSKDGLYLHKTRDYNDSSVIALLDYNEPCIVFEEIGGFARVYARGYIGYVSKKYLETKGYELAFVNSSDGLVLHGDPNFSSSSEIAIMNNKETVKWITTINEKYAYVIYKNLLGYCSVNYLKKAL